MSKSDATKGSVEDLPGGFSRIISGNTRDKININRPWQPEPPPIDPTTCPFCTKPQNVVEVPGVPSDWRVIKNLFTPHNNHYLLIPETCEGLNEAVLRSFGQPSNIERVLHTASLTIAHEKLSTSEMALFVHVGYSAGQNLGHTHWHLMQILIEKPLSCVELPREVFVKRIGGLEIFAAGARSGQCLILPARQMCFGNHINSISEVLEWIIKRGSEKFRSIQGKQPEYIVSLRISIRGNLRYASYIPILNMWGALEYAFYPLENSPISMPWTHKTTAEYLRE